MKNIRLHVLSKAKFIYRNFELGKSTVSISPVETVENLLNLLFRIHLKPRNAEEYFRIQRGGKTLDFLTAEISGRQLAIVTKKITVHSTSKRNRGKRKTGYTSRKSSWLRFKVFKVVIMSVADFGPDSGGRIKGCTIVKPLVYGNISRYFGKKREEDGHTHQWTVYVKPYANEDMSVYVKKIQFKLHESYANQTRIVTKPPYEVTETGWGEFEIIIKIFFHCPNEKPVTIYHILKLFQTGPEVVVSKKPLVSEFYEEIIFQEPTQLMKHLLNNIRPLTVMPYKHETDFEEKKEKSLQNIKTAKNKIRHEISDLKDRLKLAKETITKFKNEISRLQTEEPTG